MTDELTVPVTVPVTRAWFRDLALTLAPAASAVANYCDHVEHNEAFDPEWLITAGACFRDAAWAQASDLGLSPVRLCAERLHAIELADTFAEPSCFDARAAVLKAETWRCLQLVLELHDSLHSRHRPAEPLTQTRRIFLRLAGLVGAFAEPRSDAELVLEHLADALLFGIRLLTVAGKRLPDERLPPPPRGEGPGATSQSESLDDASVVSDPLSGLDGRQRAIAAGLSKGLSIEQIASQLQFYEPHLRRQVRRLYAALGVEGHRQFMELVRPPRLISCRGAPKMLYPTPESADEALAQATKGQQRRYWCWEHQGWHLTSQELTAPPKGWA